MLSPLALLLALYFATLAHAGLFVINPVANSRCHGGQPCTVTWADDGTSPLLNSIGACQVGLYTGTQQLVQTIEPVNVAATRSLTFTPNPAAGPNSDTYYISFISTSIKQNSSSNLNYAAFSARFTLDQMQGSFSSPLASATASIPVPSSVSAAGSTVDVPIESTLTIGSPSPNTSSTSTRFQTSTLPNSSTSTSPSSSTTTSSASKSTLTISPQTSLVVTSSSASSSSSPTTSQASSASTFYPTNTFALAVLGVMMAAFCS